MTTYAFDGEEEWLEGVSRALLGYTNDALTVLDPDTPTLYEIVEGFPADDVFDRKRMPLDKTLIHVDIDDIQNPIFGFGDNVVDHNFDSPTADQVVEVEAQMHTINFDFGVWATDRSGGGTARLRTYQRLTHIFSGTEAYRDCSAKAGIQIQSFSGGQFIIETINDIKVWRVANMTLVIQCFNRRFKNPAMYIESVSQDNSGITIDDTVIVDS